MKNERNLHGSNSIGYWAEDGYLHRYFLLRDPYITKGTTLLSSMQSQLKDALMQEADNIRLEEDDRLKDFAKAIDYSGTEEEIFTLVRSFMVNGGAGLKDIFTVLNNPKFFTSYKQYNGGYIAALFDNDHKKEAKDLAVEAMKNILTDKTNDRTAALQKQHTQEMRFNTYIEERVNNLMKGVKMGFLTTTMGNIAEPWMTAALEKGIYEALNKDSNKMKNKVENDAVLGSISVDITGGKKNKGTTRLSPADIMVRIDGKDCLPIQVKIDTTGKEKATLLKNANYEEVAMELNNDLIKKYIQFAIIHQNAFSNKNYQKLVQQSTLAKETDEGGEGDAYRFGSDMHAIESFNTAGVIPELEPAIDMLRHLMAVKLIRGVTEENLNLFYVAGSVKGNAGLIRVSDMIKEVVKRPDRLEVYQKTTGKIFPSGINKEEYNASRTREEWAAFITPKMSNSLSKIKATMTLNYADMNK